MDPITTALAAAAFLLKGMASEAVKDAYKGLKDLLSANVSSLAKLEEDPEDPDHRKATEEELRKKGLIDNSSVLEKTRELAQAIESEPADRLAAAGIDIDNLRAAHGVIVRRLGASGGVRLKDIVAEGGTIDIQDISTDAPKKNARLGGSDLDPGSLVVQGLRAGRDIVLKLAAVSAASEYAGKVEEFLEEYLVTEEGPGTVVFGGRDEELKHLDDWLTDDRAAPRLILVGPAGRGKSALLVHWLTQLRIAGRVGDGVGQWRLVFFPISMRFSTHMPRVFYEALAARLNDIVRCELKQPAGGADPASHYEDQCRRLIAVAVERKTPILIVIDGIDEALGGRFGAKWFPRIGGGAPLRVLISARLQIGDTDARGWVERLDWSTGVRLLTHELPILSFAGVRELLLKVGAPVDVLASRPEIIGRLYELTGGEPLLLRLYVEDLWKRGEEAGLLRVDDLRRLEPGFAGYFHSWFERQREAWEDEQKDGAKYDEATIKAYLLALACAYGRLTAAELNEITQRVRDVPPSFRVEDTLRPLRRIVIGTDRRSQDGTGYVLSHPKLGEFLRRDYFDRHRTEQTRLAFADWARDVLRRLNRYELAPDQASPYLLQYLGQHLEDVGGPASDFMNLTDKGWLRAWEAFENAYQGFSADLRRVLVALGTRGTTKEPLLAWTLRCQLFLRSVSSIGLNVSPIAIVACVVEGILSARQALAWLSYKQPEQRAAGLVALLPYISEEDKSRIIQEALFSARAVEDDHRRFCSLLNVSLHSPESERAAILTEMLNTIVHCDQKKLRETFDQFLKIIPASMLEEVLQVVRGIASDEDRSLALAALIPFFAPDQQDSIAIEALGAARAAHTETSRSWALSTVIPHLPLNLRDSVAQEAATIARAIREHGTSAIVLAKISEQLVNSERFALMKESLSKVSLIRNNYKGEYLLLISKYCEQLDKIFVLEQSLECVRKHGSYFSRCSLMIRIVRNISPEMRVVIYEEILYILRNIDVDLWVASIIEDVSEDIPNELLSEALSISRAIVDGGNEHELWEASRGGCPSMNVEQFCKKRWMPASGSEMPV